VEAGQDLPRRVEETRPRYGVMQRSIITFDATAMTWAARARPGLEVDDLRAILANFENAVLVCWMRRLNEEN
jgi:hypothetical protein